MSKEAKFTNLLEATKFFSSEEVCRKYLEKLIWNDKPVCPYCKNKGVYRFSDGKRFKCKTCTRKFTITVGTVLENTKIPLQKWMLAIYLVTTTKKGVSSVQLSKDIGVTQKTAWFMLQRIREVLRDHTDDKLEGIVEVDGTLIGGQFKWKTKKQMDKIREKYGTKTPRGNVGKTPLLGMMERGGKVRTIIANELDGATLQPVLKYYISKDARVFTDYFGAYKGIDSHFKEHSKTNHKAGEYVRGEVHTNSLEGYWSLVKRNISGIYHYVSPKHLFRYCAEFDFRYNNRALNTPEKFNIALAQSIDRRLRYKELIKKVEA